VVNDDLVDIEDLEREHGATGGDAEKVDPHAGRKTVGSWPVDPVTGRALVARSVLMPPDLWKVGQEIAVIEEKTMAALVRKALVQHIVSLADDPRIVQVLHRHGMLETLGLRLTDAE
jgi:hypothetical protein